MQKKFILIKGGIFMLDYQKTREDLEKEYSLCFICKTPICRYLLTGEMFYGQEIGKNKETGGMRTYECPHYEFNEKIGTPGYGWGVNPSDIKDIKQDYSEMYDELVDSYKKTSYIYKYILSL